MRASIALAEEWERRLAAEGLAPLDDEYAGPERLYAKPETIERACEPTPWSSSTPPSSAELRWLAVTMQRALLGERVLLTWVSEGVSQPEIAHRLGVSQPSVSIRVQHILKKARAMADVFPYSEADVFGIAKECGASPLDAGCLAAWWIQPSYVIVGHACGQSYEAARVRIQRAITLVAQVKPTSPILSGVLILKSLPAVLSREGKATSKIERTASRVGLTSTPVGPAIPRKKTRP